MSFLPQLDFDKFNWVPKYGLADTSINTLFGSDESIQSTEQPKESQSITITSNNESNGQLLLLNMIDANPKRHVPHKPLRKQSKRKQSSIVPFVARQRQKRKLISSCPILALVDTNCLDVKRRKRGNTKVQTMNIRTLLGEKDTRVLFDIVKIGGMSVRKPMRRQFNNSLKMIIHRVEEIKKPYELYLISKLHMFYNNHPKSLETAYLLGEEMYDIALRKLIFAITHYSRLHASSTTSTSNRSIFIYDSYQYMLKAWGKHLFDPCRRHSRVYWDMCDGSHWITTLAQLNFIRWSIMNNIFTWYRKESKRINCEYDTWDRQNAYSKLKVSDLNFTRFNKQNYKYSSITNSIYVVEDKHVINFRDAYDIITNKTKNTHQNELIICTHQKPIHIRKIKL